MSCKSYKCYRNATEISSHILCIQFIGTKFCKWLSFLGIKVHWTFSWNVRVAAHIWGTLAIGTELKIVVMHHVLCATNTFTCIFCFEHVTSKTRRVTLHMMLYVASVVYDKSCSWSSCLRLRTRNFPVLSFTQRAVWKVSLPFYHMPNVSSREVSEVSSRFLRPKLILIFNYTPTRNKLSTLVYRVCTILCHGHSLSVMHHSSHPVTLGSCVSIIMANQVTCEMFGLTMCGCVDVLSGVGRCLISWLGLGNGAITTNLPGDRAPTE